MHPLIGSDWYYKVVNHLHEFGLIRTHQAARLINATTRQALGLLKVMEQCGVVEKSEFSYPNCYQWRLVERDEKLQGDTNE